jgi:hypothetical protein
MTAGEKTRRERSYLDVMAAHFHVCNRSEPEEGPVFLKSEAWPVREMVMHQVVRLIR